MFFIFSLFFILLKNYFFIFAALHTQNQTFGSTSITMQTQGGKVFQYKLVIHQIRTQSGYLSREGGAPSTASELFSGNKSPSLFGSCSIQHKHIHILLSSILFLFTILCRVFFSGCQGNICPLKLQCLIESFPRQDVAIQFSFITNLLFPILMIIITMTQMKQNLSLNY